MAAVSRLFVLLGLFWLAGVASAIPFFPGGDVNADGVLNSSDADFITNVIANQPPEGEPTGLEADVNADGLVDEADLNDFFNLYSIDTSLPLETVLVDVNFDGVNTVADFTTILNNLSLPLTAFTSGNLSPDGVIDQNDLDVYLARGGVIPEPQTMALLLAGAATAGLRRREAGV